MSLPTYLPPDQKRFSDFAQNFVRWSSGRINLFVFGKFWIPFFPIGKKSELVWNFEILAQNPYGEQPFFWEKKGFLILLKIGSYVVQMI